MESHFKTSIRIGCAKQQRLSPSPTYVQLRTGSPQGSPIRSGIQLSTSTPMCTKRRSFLYSPPQFPARKISRGNVGGGDGGGDGSNNGDNVEVFGLNICSSSNSSSSGLDNDNSSNSIINGVGGIENIDNEDSCISIAISSPKSSSSNLSGRNTPVRPSTLLSRSSSIIKRLNLDESLSPTTFCRIYSENRVLHTPKHCKKMVTAPNSCTTTDRFCFFLNSVFRLSPRN